MDYANVWAQQILRATQKLREVLAEKREAEAQARREAIERQEMMITIAIVVLLMFSAIGSTAYLHYLGWVNIRDYMPW